MAESTMGQLKAVCQSTKTDTIYRQAAIDAVIKCDANCGIDSAEVLRALPSAERKGHWIYGEDEYGIDGYHCDKCGFFVPWDYAHTFINYIEDYNLCPSCGARMERE